MKVNNNEIIMRFKDLPMGKGVFKYSNTYYLKIHSIISNDIERNAVCLYDGILCNFDGNTEVEYFPDAYIELNNSNRKV